MNLEVILLTLKAMLRWAMHVHMIDFVHVGSPPIEVCYFDAPHVLPFKSQGPLQVFETSESLKLLIVEIDFEAW